jgi:lipopolysaccharide/colanic/teichoic acid biosynthesis glycosyltransferase
MWNVKRRIQLISKTSRNDFGILDGEYFKHCLRVERARADRNQSFFVLIRYELHNIKDRTYIKDFSYKLHTRIRKVDLIGWFDKDTIGVILHGAKHEGGWQFAVDFEAEFFTNTPPLPFTVFSYPDHWIKTKDFNDSEEDEDENEPANTETVWQTNNKTLLQNRGENAIHSSLLSKKMPGWKRALDISVSLISLIFLLPLFGFISLFIKVVSPGPVIFKQKRVGYRGRIFTLYKFRTMHINNEENSHKNYVLDLIKNGKPAEKLDDKKDKRIIPCGSILRKSCIDELPQLFNILIGDMSLVGPRPCIPYEAKEYIRWQHNRFDTVPGLTGLWQVSGKNELSFSQMIRLDIRYCRNITFNNDVKIIIFTIPTVLSFIFKGLKKVIHKKRYEETAKRNQRRLLLQQGLCNFVLLNEDNRI